MPLVSKFTIVSANLILSTQFQIKDAPDTVDCLQVNQL